MRAATAGLLTAVVFALTACQSASSSGSTTVLAASNVVELVQRVASDAGIDVAVSGAGTPQLVAQVRANGADGIDLLLLADEAAARSLAQDVPGIPAPTPFASTAVALVAPTSRPDLAGRTVEDLLADEALDWVIASPGVPLGDATLEALDGIALGERVVSLESSATDVLGKVEAGEVDLAIVYMANATPAVARDTVMILAQFPVRVTTHAQPLSVAGRALLDALSAAGPTLGEFGFERQS